MIERWRQLRRNVGLGASVRTLLIAGVFAAIAVGYTADAHDPRVAVAYGLGLAAPWTLRGVLVARLETSMRALRVGGGAILVVAFVGGWTRGQLWTASGDLEAWLLAGLAAAVAAYVSAYFWMLSDPEVTRIE